MYQKLHKAAEIMKSMIKPANSSPGLKTVYTWENLNPAVMPLMRLRKFITRLMVADFAHQAATRGNIFQETLLPPKGFLITKIISTPCNQLH
jgi:hypothetical protein